MTIVETVKKFEALTELAGLSTKVEAAIEAATVRNFQALKELGWEELPMSTPEEIEENGDFTEFFLSFKVNGARFNSTISVENSDARTVELAVSRYASNGQHMNFSVTKRGSSNAKVKLSF